MSKLKHYISVHFWDCETCINWGKTERRCKKGHAVLLPITGCVDWRKEKNLQEPLRCAMCGELPNVRTSAKDDYAVVCMSAEHHLIDFDTDWHSTREMAIAYWNAFQKQLIAWKKKK